MTLKKLIFSLLIFSIFEAHSKEIYRIALLESYPWAYRTESNEIKGIYPELFNSLEKKEDSTISFDIQLMPLARIIQEMKISRIELTIMSYNASRKINMVPQIAIYKTPFVLFTSVNSNIEKLADIKNKLVTMLIGGSGCPCLTQEVPYKKVYISTHLQGFKMLMKDRVDAVSGPYLRLNQRVKELGIQEYLASPIIYEWRSVSLWSSHELAQKTIKLDLLIKEMSKWLESDQIKNFLSEYFSPSELKYIIRTE